MELDQLGRILSQMEQASAHFLAATCVRLDDYELQALEKERDDRDVLAERMCTRARHGRCYPEDQDVFVLAAGMQRLNISDCHL